MPYRADIDGLRAIAVLSVLFFHVDVPFVSGGYVGVDVFFVISGYLITSGILEDIDKKRFSIVDFYCRRIRRILPALVFTLCLSMPIFYALMLPEELADYLRTLVAAICSVSNVYFWKTSGYFDPAAGTRPLLHTWSLAVEEQFYLFVPIFMSIALKYSRSFTLASLAGGAVISLAMSIFLTARAPSANFFLLPTRAWELLVGALIAMLGTRAFERASIAAPACWLGLALIGAAVTLYGPDTAFPGLAAIPPVLGAALLIAFGNRGDGWIGRLLAAGPMVAIGKISYSLYLVHWPVLVATRYWLLEEPGLVASMVVCFTSFVLAALSWKYVENPFRYASNGWLAGRALFVGTAGTIATLSVLGYVGATALMREVQPNKEADAIVGGQAVGWETSCFLENRPHSDWNATACLRTSGKASNALLWGDSFAAHYVAGITRLAEKADVNILQYTSAGCPPIFGYRSLAIPNCMDFNDNVGAILAAHDIKIVILSARWDLLRGRGLEAVRSTVDTLADRGLDVYVIGASPIFSFRLEYMISRHPNPDRIEEASWQIGDGLFERNALLKAQAGRATFVDPLEVLCPNRKCVHTRHGQRLFTDYGHFSTFGSGLAVEEYFPFFRTGRRRSDL